MANNEILSPKVDVVFQALFGEPGSERITKQFLESILEEKIESIDLSKNTILRREYKTDKLGVLDVIAKINGKENCHIEMQVGTDDFIIERLLYYWSKVYSKQIKKKQDYDELERTIAILIADFEIKGLKQVEYITKWKIIEEKNRKLILTDKLEIVIIELKKIKGKERVEGQLLDWLFFLDSPNSERVKEKMKENKALKEASEKLQTMSEEDYMERIAWLREKAILDYNSGMSSARRKGMQEGRKEGRKEGMQEGERKGRKEGETLGIAKGEKIAKLETAKKLLKQGVEISIITNATDLSEEEIMSIQ